MNSFSKNYGHYNKVLFKGHPMRNVKTPEIKTEKMSGLEFLNISKVWGEKVREGISSHEYFYMNLEQNKTISDFIASDVFPNWLKEPDKTLFNNEEDYEIAFKFYFFLVHALHKKANFR